MKDTRQKFEKTLDAALRVDISKDSYQDNTIQGLLKRIEKLEKRVEQLEAERIMNVDYEEIPANDRPYKSAPDYFKFLRSSGAITLDPLG